MGLAATVFLTLAASVALSGKSSTLLITISGPWMERPIEITDSSALRIFTDRVEGFIVDWSGGPAAPKRAGGLLYVTFHVSPIQVGDGRTFRVGYLCDRATRRGYVFLPAVPDDAPGPVHQWFPATAAWDRFVGCSVHGAVPIQGAAEQSGPWDGRVEIVLAGP